VAELTTEVVAVDLPPVSIRGESGRLDPVPGGSVASSTPSTSSTSIPVTTS
jgi:hypothetical protein